MIIRDIYNLNIIRAVNDVKLDGLFNPGVLRGGTTVLADQEEKWSFVVLDHTVTDADDLSSAWGDRVSEVHSFMVSPDANDDSLYELHFKAYDDGIEMSKADPILDRINKDDSWADSVFSIKTEPKEISDGGKSYTAWWLAEPEFEVGLDPHYSKADHCNFIRQKLNLG